MIIGQIFNKKKQKSIILLHGLYTTSGFWLSYFNLFRDFRIITYDITYDLLLKEKNVKFYLEVFEQDFKFTATVEAAQ